MPDSFPLPAPQAEAIEREVRLQRLLMVYIVAGLMFMLLPGTFLGVCATPGKTTSTRDGAGI
jgi:hypothetical protein